MGAAGDDQRVVAEPLRRRHPRDRAEVQLARVEVEVGDLSQQDADVAGALEDRAQGIGDLTRRERPGRDLVRERLKEMEVAAIDERDLDRRTPQPRHRLQAAETSADDDNVVDARGVGSAHYSPGTIAASEAPGRASSVLDVVSDIASLALLLAQNLWSRLDLVRVVLSMLTRASGSPWTWPRLCPGR